ncbi:ABC-2 family transporter protein [bacterium BMS3Abin02]|nr:ABC-2 family transporter protein [bacterium BMS3Abin02]GBE20702.1 ABC-2 family transporter protein [bacterium BMS3Bbin01]
MKVWTIAGTNVLRMVRDRRSFFFIFVLPLLLTLVLGAVFGGSFLPRLGVVGGDDGPLARSLMADLQNQSTIRVLPYADLHALLLAVERGEVEAGLEIPKGYDEQARTGVELGFIARSVQEEAVLRTMVGSVVAEQNRVLRAAGFVEAQGLANFDVALSVAKGKQRDLAGVSVVTSLVGEPVSFTRIGRFDLGAHSQLILFMFLTSLAGSAALIRSRMLGVSRRMVATPTPIRTIVVGEAMGRFGVAMVQGLFIVLGTWLVFGVDWGDPLGTGAVLVMFSLVSAGAAMLIGSLFRNDAQAGGIGVLLGLGFGALGGCMVPLQVFQIFSPGLYTAAHITPHAWALEAFIEMVQRGGGLVDILPELAILGGYAVVFLGLASWALHRSLTRP